MIKSAAPSLELVDTLMKTVHSRAALPERHYATIWGDLDSRLVRVASLCRTIPGASDMLDEIKTAITDNSLAHLALLAVERRLDALSLIAAVMPVIERDRRRQEGCRKGGKSVDRSRLPPSDELEAEAIRLVTHRLIPARAVRKTLACKYGVTPEAVGKVLRRSATK